VLVRFSLGVPGLKRVVGVLFAVACCGLWLACSGYKNNGPTGSTTTGVRFRAFVSNRTGSSGGNGGIDILDAAKDQFTPRGFIAVGPEPTAMFLSQDRKFTLVFNPSTNQVAVVDNAKESTVANFAVADAADSMVLSADASRVFVAVRNAPVFGQPPGAVQVVSISSGSTLIAALPIPGVRWLAQSANGNRIVALSDTMDTIAVIAPSNVGTNTNPVTLISDASLSRPVAAVITSDGTTAYVLSCGPQCGGTATAVTKVDLTANAVVGTSISLGSAGGTTALLSGSTLFVAGTPPNPGCDPSTQLCGTFSVVDLAAGIAAPPVPIADGYHGRIALTSNGRAYVGSTNCTSVTSGTDLRGCLSIVNLQSNNVTVAPNDGDVTGIQPLPNRNVVYVIQKGELKIYDATTDKTQDKQLDIVGQAVDVVVPDR
jgi:hypothetical protein